MSGKSLLIFCSSSFNIDPEFNEEARKVVRAVSSKGYGIVSGGAAKGTMGVVADEAGKSGLGNVGVIPRFLGNVVHPLLSEVIWTDTMSERKERMREAGPDVALALPGGVGTMDELFETLTLAKLGKYEGKVIAYNFKGFYDVLKKMMDNFLETGMIDSHTRELIHFPENIDQLLEIL